MQCASSRRLQPLLDRQDRVREGGGCLLWEVVTRIDHAVLMGPVNMAAGSPPLRGRGSGAEPVEGGCEGGVGPCSGQDGVHLAECLLDGDTEMSRGMERGDGRCAADPSTQ
jgi:hypothetical protein